MKFDPPEIDMPALDNTNKSIKRNTFKKGITITISLTLILFVIFIFTNINCYLIKIEFRDVLALFTVGIITTTLFYHKYNLRLNQWANTKKLELDRYKMMEDYNRNKLIFACNITSEWRNGMQESAKIIHKIYDTNSPFYKALRNENIIEFVRLLEVNIEEKTHIIKILNYLEGVSLDVYNDLADEKYLFMAYSPLYIRYWKIFKSYIVYRREISPELFKNFENLALKWANHAEKLI